MELNLIMDELMSLGSERTKKVYISNGAQEPVFGVTISAMKPIFKKIKYNQPFADRWIDSGKELTMSAGWSCFDWLLGTRKDKSFNLERI